MTEAQQIIDAIHGARRVVVTTHEKPDGDAVGATLGLARILRAAGLTAVVTGLAPVPPRYRSFISGDDLLNECRPTTRPGDLLLVLDCGAIDRAPAFVADWLRTVPVVNIDHHLSNDRFGTINWVDPTSSSAGEMVHRLAGVAGWDIPPAAAEALWVAIVTDTGRFAYDNTSPEVLRAAADLVSRGVSTADIDRRIYESVSERELRLRGKVLSGLEIHAGGKIAGASLSMADFASLDAGPEDAEDVVNLPRSIHGVELAFFAYEVERPDKAGGARIVTKISVRSKEPHDGAALCGRFGGGGHARAAGCTIEARLPESKHTFLAAAESLFHT